MTVLLITPLLVVNGVDVLWSGPVVPVLGQLDVTTEELTGAAIQAVRLAAVTLGRRYALLLDHDALLRSARFARRSALVVALATRLVPSSSATCAGLSRRCAGAGWRWPAFVAERGSCFPIVAGSLERALNLAEAMEARGYGRAGTTRAPSPGWRSGRQARPRGVADARGGCAVGCSDRPRAVLLLRWRRSAGAVRRLARHRAGRDRVARGPLRAVARRR